MRPLQSIESQLKDGSIITSTEVPVCQNTVRCFKPNASGELVLVKTLNIAHRIMPDCHPMALNLDQDGNKTMRKYKCVFIDHGGMKCGVDFSSASGNAMYCEPCRIKRKYICRKRSQAKRDGKERR